MLCCGVWNCAVCCIYHKPKAFDESSSESDSSSDSESDSESCTHNHSHSHRGQSSRRDGAQLSRNQSGGSGVVHKLSDDDEDEVNMYERNPVKKPKKGKMPARSSKSFILFIHVPVEIC